ncbi:DUF2515 family protein [Paenibacillus sp. M1]|uniref:DUF2515 family protein n=1 Tax=Paenibacillus haidiansis TaxID=1574488 RepID=A0ABU7VYP6_9BACL
MKQQLPHDPDPQGQAPGLKDILRRLPSVIGEAVKGKAADIADSSKLREDRVPLDWNEASARTVAAEIEDLLRRGPAARALLEGSWSEQDLALAEEIALATSRAGSSNITRTEAYLACYQAYPELQWAFLAHMVSRNAGWNMTDLRGRLADLLDENDKRSFYRFLERSNALIFQDAYPQLMLYMKSRELGSSQFHLLPFFHVSRFMRPFWERFWIDRGSALLTVGLIINEQNYIEKRVMRHPYYQKYAADKASFHLNSLAGLNQIVFPLWEEAADGDEESGPPQASEGGDRAGGRRVRRLAGRVVSDFGSLADRIALGKGLYAMLMGLRAVKSGAQRFADRVPHSGSRADYWPELFTANKEEALTSPVQGSELLEGETLPLDARLYSPKLLDAWGDTPYEPITREDWLRDHSALDGISAPQPPYLCDISREHRGGILKAALAHDVAAGGSGAGNADGGLGGGGDDGGGEL